jgi:hypothetical protein
MECPTRVTVRQPLRKTWLASEQAHHNAIQSETDGKEIQARTSALIPFNKMPLQKAVGYHGNN